MLSNSFIIGFSILYEMLFFDGDFLSEDSKDFKVQLVFMHIFQFFLFLYLVVSREMLFIFLSSLNK